MQEKSSVGMLQVKLHIPTFTMGKSQLSALEVEEIRSITNVRIHIERVIGVVRQKYIILQGTLPISFMSKRIGEDIAIIDYVTGIGNSSREQYIPLGPSVSHSCTYYNNTHDKYICVAQLHS